MKQELKIDIDKVRRELEKVSLNYMQRRRWELWEDEIVKEFSLKLPCHEIAKQLNRTVGQVEHRKSQLGLRHGNIGVYPVRGNKAK